MLFRSMRDITDVEGKTFLDPCCGSGNFIIEAIKKGFAPENVYGFDTDENAVAITKKRIKELCGYESDNIFCEDFLRLQPIANSQQQPLSISQIFRFSDSQVFKFDYIFTNPPWGKKSTRKTEINIPTYSTREIATIPLLYFISPH